jgi:hypothetical protein
MDFSLSLADVDAAAEGMSGICPFSCLAAQTDRKSHRFGLLKSIDERIVISEKYCRYGRRRHIVAHCKVLQFIGNSKLSVSDHPR